MAAILLDGKTVSTKIFQDIESRVPEIGRPQIAAIMVGEHPASLIYVNRKREACESVGINFEKIELPTTISKEDLVAEIHKLNADSNFNGFILQLPLPEHLLPFQPQIIREISPHKDIDGFHAYNLGKMFIGTEFEFLPPATPLGIIKLLEAYNIELQGLDVVVVGHSNLVGKPISTMLLNRNATVTTCHIHTKDLSAHTRRADLLIVAVGKPELIKADMVKTGAIVVDVGINRVEDASVPKGYRIVGDVDFAEVSKKASHITPVPGGCGPMTIAALLLNTMKAAERQREGVESIFRI